MSKEPSMIDDQILLFGEGNLPPEKLAALERMEKRIRSDETAKVREECAKAIEPFVRAWDIARQRLPSGSVAEYEALAKHHLDGAAFSRIAALRGKGAEHG